MAGLNWTEPALDDLNEILEYIALSNQSAAQKLAKTVFDAVDRLEDFPLSGRIPPELEDLSYREVLVNPCRVLYKITDDKVFILHVLRQERDLKRYLLGS